VAAVDQPLTRVDPVTYAVVRNGLIAAGRAAFTAFKRTAMHPLIYEMHDFAVSVYDDRLNLIADSADLPALSGSLGETVPSMVAAIGRENLGPGDVLLCNLPHLQGMHPPDGILVEPVFVDGEIAAFMVLRSHMGDVGGASIFPTTTTEVFQEGLLLPPLKLVEAGVTNDLVVRIIGANSRLPDVTVGDFLGGVAGVRIGAAALRTLIERYGVETYHAVVDELLDHGERTARHGVEQIPDGVYTAESALDDNGVLAGVPVPVKVTVTVAGSDLIVDTTGSAPQQAAPINCHHVLTQASARFALKTFATPGIPANSGEHRVLTTIAPEGSMFNPAPTAASFFASRPVAHLVELIFVALAQALPGEAPAMSGCDLAATHSLIRNPRSGRFTFSVGVSAPGHGARQGGDGPSALNLRGGAGVLAVAAEVLEQRFSIVRHRYELVPDSGGPGRWRGGLGMETEQEYLSDGLGFIGSYMSSGAGPILGLAGGRGPSRMNGIRYYAGTDKELAPPNCRADNLPIAPGDRAISWTAGGGGYGDPLERDVAAVAQDVKNDYVTRERALEDYGVAVAADGTARRVR
jgi:N-methylhydantoinase B